MDNRDLIGFVDGTENPEGQARALWTIVGDEDPDHAGGSYVTVQRYVTDFAKWGSIPAELTEEMLERMFVADADGVYDRLLDFSRAVTGTNFFAPSLEVLEALADPPATADSEVAAPAGAPASDGTLGIGSLRRR